MTYPDDDDFTEYTVASVEDAGTHWSVTTSDRFVFGFLKVEGATPKEGSALRKYPSSFFASTRGVFVDGNKVYYRTAAEDALWLAQGQEDADNKKRAEAKANEADVDARVARLPAVLQDRIKGFRERNADFCWEFEPYELFCLEQAVLLAEALKTPDAIVAFGKAEYNEQRCSVPALSTEHSGNTFGFSVRLAHLLVSNLDDLVKNYHGALCPLVGCDQYGCYAVTPEAEAARAEAKANETDVDARVARLPAVLQERLRSAHFMASKLHTEES